MSTSWLKYIKTYCKDNGVKLIFGSGPSANIKDKTINIPYPDESKPDNLIMTKGFIKHELGHILYSKSLTEPNIKIFETANMLEDIRIENKFSKAGKGIQLDFRDLYNKQNPKLKEMIEKYCSIVEPTTAFNVAAGEYLKTGRTAIADLLPENLKSLFMKNRLDILERFNKCENTKEIHELAKYCNKLIKEIITSKEPGPIPQPKNSGEKQEQKENKSEQVPTDKAHEKDPKPNTEQINKQIQELAGTDTFIKSNLLNLNDKNWSTIKYIFDGKINLLSSKDFPTYQAKPIEKSPTLINQIRRTLQDILIANSRCKILGNQTHGKISARSLYKTITQPIKPRTYKKKYPGKSNNIDLAIMIDCSGSMTSPVKASNGEIIKRKDKTLNINISVTRLDCAQSLSINLHEALKNIRQINYSMTGYTTDDGSFWGKDKRIINPVQLFQFKKFNSKVFDEKMLYIAEKLTEHNNDYESIKYIKTELLKQRNGRKIMFIISDGLPNIKKFPPGIMIDLTKKEIEQCKAENIEIYCFFIGDISAVTLARKIYGENNLIFLNPADLTDKIKNKLKAIIK